MDHIEPVQTTPWRNWGTVAVLLALATLACWALDTHVSLISQAMIYVLAVVVGAYRLAWLPSVACAVGAVTALNYFFVPPRWTFEVESREHLIALSVMLAVALVISHLAARLRQEVRHAQQSESRAHQLQALATGLVNTSDARAALQLGQSALDASFGGPNTLVLADALDPATPASTGLAVPAEARDGLRSCMAEGATLGPGTGRWPGLKAWYIPLGEKGKVLGAARVLPALSQDDDGREHAQALLALVAQCVGRLQLAASAERANLEAQRQQVQSTFLAAISHDVRTPLAAIIGAASALQTQSGKLSAAEQARLLESIASEASYLSTLTENTMQFLQLGNAGQALQRDWESLEEIVGAVLARTRQRNPERRIRSSIPPGLPLVKANAVLVSQLVGNLLDNALKYTDGDITLAVSQSDSGLTLAVKDRGPGISAAQQALIFEPYQRGDQTGPHGAGLGLALCRAIAVAHGGSLTLRNRSGGGCSFTVTLPVDPQPVAGDAV